MAKHKITSVTGGGGIQLDLSQQELLILQLNNAVLAATNAVQYLGSAINAIPDLSSQGIMKSYIGDDGDLSLYVIKGQEMQTLTEVMHQFALDTYEKFIDADRVAALEVENLILNSGYPKTSSATEQDRRELAENQEIVREYPNEVLENLMNQGEES